MTSTSHLLRLRAMFDQIDQWETKANHDAPWSVICDIANQWAIDDDDYDMLLDEADTVDEFRDVLDRSSFLPEGWAPSWADGFYAPDDDTF